MSSADVAASLSPITSHGSEPTPGVADELRRTFDAGTTRPLAWRRAQLEGLRAFYDEHEAAILAAVATDLAKPPLEALAAEIGAPRGDVDEALKRLEQWVAPRKVGTALAAQPGRSHVQADPLGVVLIIAPWNYPFALALQPLVGAIAAGNCVVVKPSEITPTCSALMAELLPRYLDADAIRIVEGGVPETTELLAQRWDHVFYTGNGAVGRIVMRAAADHLTPVTLELGGKSPCIVDASCDLDVAVSRIAWGKFFNAGQTCVAPDYVLVDATLEQEFLRLLAAKIIAFYGTDPKDSADYGRIVNDRHHARVAGLIDGGTPVAGGDVTPGQRYIAPTVLTDVDLQAPVMQEEIFGPVLPVIPVADVAAAIAFVNARPKPLALYVFATDEEVVQAVLDRTSSGGVTVNHTWLHLANPNLPFGGVGESGMGAYHGRTSFDTFSHHKAVLHKPAGMDLPLLYPPHTRVKKAIVKRLM
ncbi:aldehyde dehydrogenase [soil metagenome]